MEKCEPSILCSSTGREPGGATADKEHLSAALDGSGKLRLAGLAVGVGCLAILVVAWHLSPDWLPFGAKTQLSLGRCAFRDRTGYPCPTCGMTRAWGQTVRGHVVEGFGANIAGAVLALLCPIIALAGLGTAVGGAGFYDRFVGPVVGVLRPLQWVFGLVGLVILAWGWNALWAWVG